LRNSVSVAQFFDQIGGLLERHVAIVVAMGPATLGIASSRCYQVSEFIERKSLTMHP